MRLLSVIIPVYNSAAWLEQCLQSLLQAARGREDQLEVILVNDGSTDESPALIDRYAEQFELFRAVHQENGGVAAARNTGLSLASGSYIAWIDSDDYVSPDWLTSLCQAVGDLAPDIMVMDSVRFDRQGFRPEVYGRTPGLVSPDRFYADTVRDSRMLGGLPNKVIRREFYEGIRFDPALPILEDYAVILDLIAPAKRVVYIPQGLYYYRQQEASLLHQVDADRAFFSVKMALRRMETVPRQFRKEAACAVLIQILAFCYHRKTSADFSPEAFQLRVCHSFLRRHLITALLDPDFTLKTKGKMVLLALKPKL